MPMTAGKARANKAKGRKGQQDVRDLFLAEFEDLQEDDIYSRPMGSPGSDLMMSPLAQSYIPYDVEVKRGKAFNLVRACQQAEGEGRGKYPPLAIGRYDNEKDWYICLKFKDFIALLKRGSHE